ILNQTYDNFELLLVDDGSPDKSGRICDEYALADTRVKVFHKENGGVSSARNLGIDNAQGEYLVFVDSDDYVGQDYLSHLLQVESSQLVIGGIDRVKGESHEFLESDNKHIVVSKDLFSEWNHSTKKFFYWYPFAKLFCMDIINKYQLRFNTKLFYSEDFCFVMDYILKVQSFDIMKVHDYVLYVEPNENRSIKYRMSAEELISHHEIHEALFSELEQICNGEFLIVRSSVYRRFFNRYFVYLFLNAVTSREQIMILKKWSGKDKFFNLVFGHKWTKKRLIFSLMYYMPCVTAIVVALFYRRYISDESKS
ncbi:MAG: glycosyltransferase, partial [Paludibacteraceae bacterium]|nr:glycosyltransferase [Paludibacteraceae bacterium]